MKQFFRNLIWIGLIGLIGFGLGRVYFRTSFPYTHDGENHLARFANYKLALKEGQFPPRLAPNLLNHFTYPVLNFNYPLANILSLPLSFLKLNYELSFKLIALTALLVLGVSSHQWLKSLGFSKSAGIFSLLGLFSAPFLVNIVWFRGNIGELLALALFATGLWLTESWSQSPQKTYYLWWLGLTGVGVLLAHNLAALMIGPILLLYGLHSGSWRNRLKLLLVWGLAGGLCLWFWLPAIAEKSSIVLDDAKFFQEYSGYFVTFSQLLTAPLEFGFVFPGSISGLNLSLGALSLLIIALSLIWGSLKLREKLQTPKSWLRSTLLLILVLGLIFFQTKFSLNWWQSFPVLKYLQFPWRLTLPLIVLILPLMAYWWQWASERRVNWLKLLLMSLLLGQFWPLFQLRAADYFHKTVVDYDAYGQTTSTMNENLPKGFRFIEFGDWQPTPQILQGAGNISVQSWSGTRRRYTLTLTQPSLIVEPSIVWLGFETHANSHQVNYIDSDQIQGRLAYELPVGQYQVITQFTQNTWPRRIGNGVSLTVLLGLMGWVFWKFWLIRQCKK